MRNRYNRKRSCTGACVIGGIALIVTAVVMMLINFSMSASCDDLKRKKVALSRELRNLEKDYDRERLRWDALNTPDNLRKVLPRCGLEMVEPGPMQLVVMAESGYPARGQISVQRRLARLSGERTSPIADARKARRTDTPVRKGSSHARTR